MMILTANSPKMPPPWRLTSRNNAASTWRNREPVRSLYGQVEEEMAVHDISVGFALSAPHASQASSNVASEKPLVESFPDLGEEFAIGIVEDHRARPVDRRVGNQGKADCSSVIDRLDDVS